MIKTKIRWSWATVIFVSLVPRTFGAAESKSDIANKMRTEVAGIIAGINAHDVDQATHFDSNDIVYGKRPAGIAWNSRRAQGLE